MAYGPISLWNASGQVQAEYRFPEAASQTFKRGTPVKLSSGYVAVGDTQADWTSADVVVGIAAEDAHNLTAAGTAEDGYSESTPPGQSSAKTIPVGARFKDGNCGIWRADGRNTFRISLKSGQTYSQAYVVSGTYYTLKEDSSTHYWYADMTDTSGNNAVLELVGPDPNVNTVGIFRFKAAQRQYA